jgi:hypothetical protein
VNLEGSGKREDGVSSKGEVTDESLGTMKDGAVEAEIEGVEEIVEVGFEIEEA